MPSCRQSWDTGYDGIAAAAMTGPNACEEPQPAITAAIAPSAARHDLCVIVRGSFAARISSQPESGCLWLTARCGDGVPSGTLRYSIDSSTNTGICRSVLVWYVAQSGQASTACFHQTAFPSP